MTRYVLKSAESWFYLLSFCWGRGIVYLNANFRHSGRKFPGEIRVCTVIDRKWPRYYHRASSKYAHRKSPGTILSQFVMYKIWCIIKTYHTLDMQITLFPSIAVATSVEDIKDFNSSNQQTVPGVPNWRDQYLMLNHLVNTLCSFCLRKHWNISLFALFWFLTLKNVFVINFTQVFTKM